MGRATRQSQISETQEVKILPFDIIDISLKIPSYSLGNILESVVYV